MGTHNGQIQQLGRARTPAGGRCSVIARPPYPRRVQGDAEPGNVGYSFKHDSPSITADQLAERPPTELDNLTRWAHAITETALRNSVPPSRGDFFGVNGSR